MLTTPTRLIVVALAASLVLPAQLAPSRPFETAPPPQTPPATAAQPAANPADQNAPQSNAPQLTSSGGLLLNNVSLVEFIDILAKRLKINYVLDPGVAGRVTVYTYGEVKPVDLMQLLETMLRVNGAAMVKVGDLYRIVPVARINSLPLQPTVTNDAKTLPDDERIVLNMIFLKYTA